MHEIMQNLEITNFVLPNTDIGLYRAVTPQERTRALQSCLEIFTHDEQEKHDRELYAGADTALCIRMGYAVVGTSFPNPVPHTMKQPMKVMVSSNIQSKNKDVKNLSSHSTQKEIVLICKCLIQVYKCSIELRLQSFRHIGATELVPLLVHHLVEPSWKNFTITTATSISKENELTCWESQQENRKPTIAGAKTTFEYSDKMCITNQREQIDVTNACTDAKLLVYDLQLLKI